MHKIYNFILVQTNEKLQEKVALYATFQVVNTEWEPIVYLMILKMIFDDL